MIARIALAAGALVLAALLALELHAETRLQDGKRAASAGERALRPDQRGRVLDDLRAGERLHPGTEALLAQALVHLHAGENVAAERLARRAVDREPRNWEAWRVLAATLDGRDHAAATRALRRSRRLAPRAL